VKKAVLESVGSGYVTVAVCVCGGDYSEQGDEQIKQSSFFNKDPA